MKKPKSLEECRTADEAQAYIIANDGLSDEDFAHLEFVEVGPSEDVAEIIPVPLDSDTAAKIRKIAKRAGKTPNMLIRDWAADICRREFAPKKRTPPKDFKKRATG